MNIVPAGIQSVFVTASNSSSLNIGLSIYQLVDDSMELVHGPTAMQNFVGNVYRGQYTPGVGNFVAFIAVYTDSSLQDLLPNYEQEVQSFYSAYRSGPCQSVVGMVDCGDQVVPSPTFKIFLGDAETMFLRVVDEAFKPIDLSECTEIAVNFLNSDGTTTRRLLSLDQVDITAPAVLGQFSVPISSLISAAFNVGEFQTIDVTFTISARKFTVPFNQALSVYE